ncbi:MAG: DUF4179 domain-containing protein [Chloroflexota bacterium]
MKENHMKDALENIARRAVPEDVNLMPKIAARLEGRSFMTTLRARPVLTILLVLMLLALLTSVAYAIGKVMGYIPGIGMIDQSLPLRILAEPISVTRDGITLTVEQVVLSADKTVVVYKVEGIPLDAYTNQEASQGNNAGTGEGDSSYSFSSSAIIPIGSETPEVSHSSVEKSNICFVDDHLSLPDGTLMSLQTGEGSGWSSGFENRHVFGPIPDEINKAVFLVSCIPETAPGALPENWEIPLQFVSAPPDMAVLPVIGVAPSTSATDNYQPAMTVDQVIETNDGYILIGKFRLNGFPSNVDPIGFYNSLTSFIDAKGQIVRGLPASGIPEDNKVKGEFPWAYEIQGKQYAWPITITMDAVNAYLLGETTEFEFDTGADPQVGQTWYLKPDAQIAGYKIREVSIKRTSNAYEFQFLTDPDVQLFYPEIVGIPFSTGGGQGSDNFHRGQIYYQLEYKGEPPSGKLMIKLSDLQVLIHGPWQMQWSPKDSIPMP